MTEDSAGGGRWVHVGEADIFLVEDGPPTRPTLLLFSGARCNTGMWEPVLAGLSDRFHVVRHDVRGTGRSRLASGAELGLDRFADDAAAVLDALGVVTCTAWGMAFGARVALAFVSRHPQRVTRLALYDASVEPPDPGAQRDSAKKAEDERRRLGIRESTREPRWFQNDDPDTLATALRATYADTDHRRYIDGISVPTLIATGDLDPNLPASRRLHQAIPGSELVVLEATGHGSVIQRPELCLSVFQRFAAPGML